MCMQPVAWPEPDPQVAAAIAAMYGSRKTERPLAVLIRDRLGEWLRDEDFAAAFGTRGKPGWSPSRRALVTVLQRAENLTDRRAPMRCGPGSTGGTCWACLLMIRGLATRCWLSSGARGARRVCVPFCARRYGTPMTSWRPPASQARRDELAVAYAKDGYALLGAACDSAAPAWLRELPAAGVLRRVLLQNYTRTITKDGREVIRRREKEPEGDGLPPGHARIASPYDLDARRGVKREEFWLGYKLHITETCDDAPPCTCRPAAARQHAPEGGRYADAREHDKGCAHLVFPNLITNVATTGATVTDNQMTGAIHDELAEKNLAPGRHYLDSG